MNRISKLDQYPILKIEDLLVTLKGGRYFSKLDLQHTYQQLKLDAESQEYVFINTKRGLFRYTRLPFGIIRGVGSEGQKGQLPPPFSKGKEQNLHLTCLDLAPWSFKLDFVSLS